MRNKIKSNVNSLKNIIQEVSNARVIGEWASEEWVGPLPDDDDSFEAIASDAFFGTWVITDIYPICAESREDFVLDRSSKAFKSIGKKLDGIEKAVQYTKRVLYPNFEYAFADFTEEDAGVVETVFSPLKPIRSIDSDAVLKFKSIIKDKRKFEKVIDKLMKTKSNVHLCFEVNFKLLNTDDDYISYLYDPDCTDWHVEGVQEYFDRFMWGVK